MSDATKSLTSDRLRDDSLEDLRKHLNQWWSDRVNQTTAGSLLDHQYIVYTLQGLIQDTGELFNITLGILDRLIEVNDLQLNNPEANKKATSKAPKQGSAGISKEGDL